MLLPVEGEAPVVLAARRCANAVASGAGALPTVRRVTLRWRLYDAEAGAVVAKCATLADAAAFLDTTHSVAHDLAAKRFAGKKGESARLRRFSLDRLPFRLVLYVPLLPRVGEEGPTTTAPGATKSEHIIKASSAAGALERNAGLTAMPSVPTAARRATADAGEGRAAALGAAAVRRKAGASGAAAGRRKAGAAAVRRKAGAAAVRRKAGAAAGRRKASGHHGRFGSNQGPLQRQRCC